MVKLLFLFLVTLCLAQNFQGIFADSEEEDYIQMMLLKLEDITQIIGNYYEENIKIIVEANNITLKKLFNYRIDYIEDHCDDSSIALKCSKMASEELHALIEKTKTDNDNCISIYKNKIIDDMKQVIIQKVESLAEDTLMKVTECAEEFIDDDIWASKCYEIYVINEFEETMKQMEEPNLKMVVKSKMVAKDLDICLRFVNIDAQLNTKHVTDEFKSCIEQD